MSKSAPDKTRARSAKDRRVEARRPARGSAWVEVPDGSGEQQVRLVDVSPSGFRARHGCTALSAGQEVRFRHAWAAGVAVVVWNRILGDNVESGFLIVSRSA